MSHYIFEKPGLFRDYPESEFVIANILAKWRKLEPNDFDFSQHFSQKVCKESVLYFYTVNSEFFARILFSQIALKDKFAK